MTNFTYSPHSDYFSHRLHSHCAEVMIMWKSGAIEPLWLKWQIKFNPFLGMPSTDHMSERLSSGWTRSTCCGSPVGISSAISSRRDLKKVWLWKKFENYSTNHLYSASVRGSEGSETAFSILQQSERASRSWISNLTPSSNFLILSSIDSRELGIFWSSNFSRFQTS